MVELSLVDHQELNTLLVSTTVLASERGREAVIESANLHDLRPHMQLEGPAVVVIPLMVSFLRSYGRISYEHEPLGRFLAALKDYVGLNQKRFLDRIISQYDLMTPAVNAPGDPENLTPVSATEFLEKIIGENTLRPISFLAKGLEAARSVVYIEVKGTPKPWSGTGFMISPRLLLTNHHVLPAKELAASTLVRFNYQDRWDGNPELAEDFRLEDSGMYISNSVLDYAIVEVRGKAGTKWGHLRLQPQIPDVGSRVNIIQHPHGLPKQVSVQNNLVKYSDIKKIQYVTSTLPGSSGAPVFNDRWEVIGLHRLGGILSETENGPTYPRNEATALKAILYDLSSEIVAELTVD